MPQQVRFSQTLRFQLERQMKGAIKDSTIYKIRSFLDNKNTYVFCQFC